MELSVKIGGSNKRYKSSKASKGGGWKTYGELEKMPVNSLYLLKKC